MRAARSHACDLLAILILAVASAGPGRAQAAGLAPLPAGGVIGVAPGRGVDAELPSRVSQVLAGPPGLRVAGKALLHARVLWLESWKEQDRERMDAEGVDHVVLVERARGKSLPKVTRQFVRAGDRVGIAFYGARSEVELALLRRGPGSRGWEQVGRWSREDVAAEPASLLLLEKGEKEVRVDPDRYLAARVAEGIGRGADFLAAEALWSRRADLRQPGARVTPPGDARLWDLVREVGEGTVSFPRASVCAAAARAWERLQLEWSGSTEPAEADTCGWCGGPAELESVCACAGASELEGLLRASELLLDPAIRAPELASRSTTESLRGDRPREANARSGEVVRALEGYPRHAFDWAFEDSPASWRAYQQDPVHVLFSGEELEPLLTRLDPDYLVPARWFASGASETYARRLGVRDAPPVAAILERDPRNWQDFDVLEVVKGRALEPRAVEELLERVMWSEFQPR